MTRDIAHYESAYLEDYGFEAVMVTYRHRLLLERLAFHVPRIVVEVGCGADLLYRHYLDQGGSVERWIIVEPGEQFANAAQCTMLPNLHVIRSFFEEASAKVIAELPAAPDFIICSGVLHEVPDAALLLRAAASLMDAHTLLHVNVPNAGSFHRRLARSMGMLEDLKTMSLRNLRLLQHRVYDIDTLVRDLEAVGLRVTESGGYLIKPFTHAQMEQIVAVLDGEVLEGLFQLGKELPEWASEIFAEASKATP